MMMLSCPKWLSLPHQHCGFFKAYKKAHTPCVDFIEQFDYVVYGVKQFSCSYLTFSTSFIKDVLCLSFPIFVTSNNNYIFTKGRLLEK